jgi:hypothetical protein
MANHMRAELVVDAPQRDPLTGLRQPSRRAANLARLNERPAQRGKLASERPAIIAARIRSIMRQPLRRQPERVRTQHVSAP